jgi:hypothetical protein
VTLLLGLRLALAGGRRSLLPLAVTAVGVGVGVVVLLLALTGQAAAQGRAERSGWQGADEATTASAPDPVLFLSVTDYHDGTVMTRAYVAALGPEPPVPPGLDQLPGPGEVAVSPALGRLLAATPGDELDARFRGRIVATIDDEGIAHPDELVAVIGRTPEQLDAVESQAVHQVRGFGSLSDGYAIYLGLRVYLLMGAALLLVPVVIFIVMATRVAAAQREHRLATVRLAGATRRQAAVLAAVETGLGATAGSILGWIGYEVGRRVVAATVTFQGARFFAEDVAVAPWVLALVLVGIPALAMLTAVVTLRRVQTGPLATSRRARRGPLSPWRALPVAVGVGGLLLAALLQGAPGGDIVERLGPLFVALTVVGLVAVGPWLCMVAAGGVVRLSRRAPGLLAARRMGGDPRATFRAVSGVVVAAFAVTYAASLVDPATDGPYDGGVGVLRPGVVEIVTGGVPDDTVAPLLGGDTLAIRFAGNGEVVPSCAELARMVVLSCASSDLPDVYTADEQAAANPGYPIYRVLVATDGTAAAENRVRSQAANLVPNAIIHTQQDRVDVDARFFRDLEQLLRMGWYFVLVVAACSLTVGMIAGLVERRRPFALLRASGLRLGELRQVVFLETAAAMLLTAVVGVGLGLAASWALAVYGELAWALPGLDVFVGVGTGVLAALVLTTLALPLVDATTRHDAVRFE